MLRARNYALALSLAGILFGLLGPARGQDSTTTPRLWKARSRLFPAMGPGVEEIRRDTSGNYFVMAQPGRSISVYTPEGQPLGSIPPEKPKNPSLISAVDFDIGTQGRLYIADRGADAIKIFDSRGVLLRTIMISNPVSTAALAGDDFAITDSASKHLLQVYSHDGNLPREVGDPVDVADHPKLNRLVNVGRVAGDATGNIYFLFTYFPEPTLRKYAPDGRLVYEISLNTMEFQPEAQAMRRLIQKEDQTEKAPLLKPIVNAFGVDRATGQTWMAMGDILVEFDGNGNRMATYQTYTPDGDGLHPVAILVEPERLLLAAETGIYDFSRSHTKSAAQSGP